MSTRVLLARVSALLRRNQARALSSPPAEAVTVGGLSLLGSTQQPLKLGHARAQGRFSLRRRGRGQGMFQFPDAPSSLLELLVGQHRDSLPVAVTARSPYTA